ncbi:hypothetical protein [Pseudomonas gozinkensis]|uniref:hypothetical protein n=1 Tax=Pseudomonas gozinkensis TaxID=2774461 RepID=UPI0017879902|nr:hypothetical protein [Pseudomonas gozinkensis]
MPDLKISFSVSQTPEGSNLSSFHSIKKQDSIDHSAFQYIGLLYHNLDATDEYDSRFTPAAVESFSASILNLGFPECAPIHMLATSNWKERMYIIWGFISEKSQKNARALDYEEFHNYWPSLEFCEPGWDNEVKKWFASQPCCTHSCE